MYALKPHPLRYNNKTIMVIGAGHVQEPAIRTAKALGLKVAAVDHDPNAPGLQWADYPLVISTGDAVGCIAAARTCKIDGVMTAGSDRSARTAAEVAAALGLPGIPVEAAYNATNKVSSRRLMVENDIPVPRFAVCQNRAEAEAALEVVGTPAIVKPTDSHSSLGVSLIWGKGELEIALERAAAFSGAGVWLLEEFTPPIYDGGTVEAFVVGGEVNIITTVTGQSTPPPYQGYISVTVPAYTNPQKETVRKTVVKAVQALGIMNGPLHAQIFLTADGPRVIEIAPRLGGVGLNSHLIPLAFGVSLIQATIDVSLGYTPDLTIQFERGASQHFIILPPGVVRSVPDLREFSCEELADLKLFVQPGDEIPAYHSFAVAPGYVITVGETPRDAQASAARIYREIAEKIVVDAKPRESDPL